ncbi:MAG TPA: AMP-binding protein, partial [Flavobacteriales bacterium]|nr:AMP-binding protein [Flavobacteriales bacterium]
MPHLRSTLRVTDAQPYHPFPLEAIEQSICARFAQTVAEHGNRCALLTPQRTWTYAELDAWSDALARALVQRLDHGLEPVALLLDQGATNVATTLAVLKAGKCYVPLDPTHPATRSKELFGFSGAGLILTDAANREFAEGIAGDGAHALVVDHIESASPVLALPNISKNDPAYIFFTSGTTGKPKGVVDSHRNVLHNIRRYTNALRITPADRLTMIQSPSFSGTVSSMFTALLNGATLLPFDVRAEGFVKLAAWLTNSK